MFAPRPFPKPRVYLSKCIEYCHCRYNGDIIRSDTVQKMIDKVEFITECPEAAIGLGVPRDPIRIVQDRSGHRRLVQPTTGRDVTAEMERLIEHLLSSLSDIDGFLLKSRSPTCGVRDVRTYPPGDKVSPLSSKQAGFLGAAVRTAFPHTALEDEARLQNIKLAEHFLTRIFTSARLREVERSPSLNGLIEFHTDNKFLLMMYSQKELRNLGRLVANKEAQDLHALVRDYREHLEAAMAQPPRCNAPVNVLQHALGHISSGMTGEEVQYFLRTLDMYQEGRVPLSVCLGLMRSYAIRFDDEYVTRQTFFQPFPGDILQVELTDSCDWREQQV